MKIVLNVSLPLDINMIELASSLKSVEGVQSVRIKVNVFIEDFIEAFITLIGDFELENILDELNRHKVVVNYVDEIEV